MASVDNYIKALQSVLGRAEKEIPLHEPSFEGNEWEYVKSCIDTGWVSSVGDYVTLFEKKIAEYTGSPYAVVVVNGTAALHMALILANISQGDEVLIPSLTFVATANAVAYCGAVPHFIDCDERSLGINLSKLDQYLFDNTYLKEGICVNKLTSRPIKAIIPVHVFGHTTDLDTLSILCKKYNLTIIEDASESLGSFYRTVHTGCVGDMGVLSFNGNKIITTGGGGALLLKDKKLAERAKHLTTTAKVSHGWEYFHDEIGFNYRLPNINAALGCAQMEKLPLYIERKRALAYRYLEAFSNIHDAYILQEPEHNKSNYWLNALILHSPNKKTISDLIVESKKIGYGLRGLWDPLDSLPMYQKCPKMDLSSTYNMFNRTISLPSGPALGLLL
jgi:perosamine synthetase